MKEEDQRRERGVPRIGLMPAFVADLLSPAVGLPRLREIVVEKKLELLWSWLIFPVLVLALMRPSPGLVPDDFGIFLLFFAMPSLAIAYWLVSARPLLQHIRREVGPITQAGLRIALVSAYVLVMPLFLLFVTTGFVTSDLPLFQGIGPYLILPLVGFVLALVTGSWPDVDAAFLAAAVGPLLGLPGVGHMAVGRFSSGMIRLSVGTLALVLAGVLIRVSWLDTYSWREPHQAINTGIYFLTIVYFGIWYLSMAELRPRTDERRETEITNPLA